MALIKSFTKLAKVSLVAVFVKIPYFLNITALNGRVCVRVLDLFWQFCKFTGEQEEAKPCKKFSVTCV